jgi:hypothetical protein
MIKDKVDYPMHVNAWKEIGGSMAGFCKEKEVSYQTFMYHASRMKKKEIALKEPSSFIRIDVPEKLSGSVEFHFRNGNYFVFPVSCSAQLIKSLIS